LDAILNNDGVGFGPVDADGSSGEVIDCELTNAAVSIRIAQSPIGELYCCVSNYLNNSTSANEHNE